MKEQLKNKEHRSNIKGKMSVLRQYRVYRPQPNKQKNSAAVLMYRNVYKVSEQMFVCSLIFELYDFRDRR